MSKRKLINTLKRKIVSVFNNGKKEEVKEWRLRMREELEKMAKLNGELILMMK